MANDTSLRLLYLYGHYTNIFIIFCEFWSLEMYRIPLLIYEIAFFDLKKSYKEDYNVCIILSWAVYYKKIYFFICWNRDADQKLSSQTHVLPQTDSHKRF